jgi:hypothetical protein
MKNIIWLIAATATCLAFSGCGNPSVEYNPQTETSTIEPISETTLFSDAVGITMTNAAAAGTEPSGNISRASIDLTSYSMIRAQFASSLNSALIFCRIEYSLNSGGAWSTLISNFAAAAVVDAHNVSSWATIPTAAKANVLLRAVIVGNGVLDPVIRYVRLEYY